MSLFTAICPHTSRIILRERNAGPVETEYRDLATLEIEAAETLIRHLTESIGHAAAQRKDRAEKTLAVARDRLRSAEAEVARLRRIVEGASL